jgi:peptidoglycan/LPS O-acetylase OafA/YrhL
MDEAQGGRSMVADRIQRVLSGRIPVLDGVRAIAVLLVIAYHEGLPVPGGYGVMAFFVLSGFLITWLLLREHEHYGAVSMRLFYLRRSLRIFPAFYAYWSASIVLLLLTGKQINWPHAISSFGYFADYYAAIVQPPYDFLSHTWSLAIEEQFYLLWPAAFLMLSSDLKKMQNFLISLIVGIWIYRVLLQVFADVPWSYIYYAFDTRIDHIMTGCLLAVVVKRRTADRLWNVVCANAYAPVLTLSLMILLAGLDRFTIYRNAGFIAWPVLCAILIIQWLCWHDHMLWSWLDSRPVAYLGSISYGLYLYHPMMPNLARRLPGAPLILRSVIGAAITVAIASISYYLFERRCLRLKDRLESTLGPRWRRLASVNSTIPVVESRTI